MSRICARCGKNLDLVGTAHNCLPVGRGVTIGRVELYPDKEVRAQPKPEKKIKRKR